MALQTRNKINSSFSMASMSDLVFLLLVFFMITSTMIAPNALKLLLPQSNNQTQAKQNTTVSIDDLGDGVFAYAVGTSYCNFDEVERRLRVELADVQEPVVTLAVDKTVPMEEVVKIMNIAVNNNYKLILRTAPE
ncbi:MAG: biopolymer transporter ExbD [Bacteroidales bacterium]|nr:biopolymer transporter ExbD [Bacteroidales bacterium]HOY38771.1 biopolymer transporter ExbD [Bacteroidales bacterium]HQP03398.1 biopolymer transporter ExbD [Bacteroidales bacterium]